MLTKTNICSVQNYLRGNTDRQQFENDKQNVDRYPLDKFLRTPMNDHDFSLSFFRCFRAFTHYELFVSFRSLNFGFKINRINPFLAIISSKLPAIANVIPKLLLQAISLAAIYCTRQTALLHYTGYCHR